MVEVGLEGGEIEEGLEEGVESLEGKEGAFAPGGVLLLAGASEGVISACCFSEGFTACGLVPRLDLGSGCLRAGCLEAGCLGAG